MRVNTQDLTVRTVQRSMPGVDGLDPPKGIVSIRITEQIPVPMAPRVQVPHRPGHLGFQVHGLTHVRIQTMVIAGETIGEQRMDVHVECPWLSKVKHRSRRRPW